MVEKELDSKGCQELVAAILEHAILDYKMLVDAGFCYGLKRVRKLADREEWKLRGWYDQNHKIDQLLKFILDGDMREWIEIANFEIGHKRIVQNLMDYQCRY